MGLRTNVAKTVSMAFQPCRALGGHSADEYGLCMTGEGHTYWEQLHQQVLYPECNADLAGKSLASHRQAQHGVAQGNLRNPPLPPNTSKDLPDLPPTESVWYHLPGGGMPGEGDKLEHILVPLGAPSRAGHARNLGGG